MIKIGDLNSDNILDIEFYQELYEMPNGTERMALITKILSKAKMMGVKTEVLRIMRNFEALEREKKREQRKAEMMPVNNVTDYSTDINGVSYPNLYCGNWRATDDGIYSMNTSQMDTLACYHPIMPISRLINIETGEEQIHLAYKRNGLWKDVRIPKVIISKASSITELAKWGVGVTSENARLLVKFLADVENFNDDLIHIKQSTSKLGWRNEDKDFLPYDTDIEFDGEYKFTELSRSVKESGDYAEWMKLIKEIRAKCGIEARLALAASFASPLVKITNSLPFIIDFYGTTENGKTVTLMIAASVWADPAESRYIGDFKTTDVALEMRCDMLNSLPLILDDTSKATARIRENFESLVYDICSGKGKSRSNKELGAARECNWNNVTICNGERSLSGYVEQGGAINRILEVECNQKLFRDPKRVAETVKRNYGFAGKAFVAQIKTMKWEYIKELQQKYIMELSTDETMDKQVSALALVLTADEIATKYIFQDDRNLKSFEVKEIPTKISFVSEGARCYQYILDCLDEYGQHFFGNGGDGNYMGDIWGEIKQDKGIVMFYAHAFEAMLRKEGYYRKQFTSWAKLHNLILTDKATTDTKTVRFTGESKSKRAICLKIDYNYLNDNDDNGIFSDDI